MNLYVIGPVTGRENDNREEFERVRVELDAVGHYADIPHGWVKSGADWDVAMKHSIYRMLHLWTFSREYDEGFGIAMLDGWEDSRGARIEHDLACALGIECRPWREFL